MKFKVGDILEHIHNICPYIRVIGVDTVYEFEGVEFVDGEWNTFIAQFVGSNNYVDKYYKLSTKATRYEFIKDILK